MHAPQRAARSDHSSKRSRRFLSFSNCATLINAEKFSDNSCRLKNQNENVEWWFGDASLGSAAGGSQELACQCWPIISSMQASCTVTLFQHLEIVNPVRLQPKSRPYPSLATARCSRQFNMAISAAQSAMNGMQQRIWRSHSAPGRMGSRLPFRRSACAAAALPPFIPAEFAAEVEEQAAQELMSAYKRVPIEVPSLGMVQTAYVKLDAAPSSSGSGGASAAADDAPVFVLLHGFDSSSLEFRRLLPRLQQLGAQPTHPLPCHGCPCRCATTVLPLPPSPLLSCLAPQGQTPSW